jgi:uncharacterized protein (TIGR03437 family)
VKIAALGAVLLTACISNGPQIDAVEPTTIARGGTITLTGVRFCQKAGVNSAGACAGPVTGTVDLDLDRAVRADVTSWTDTQVVVVVPMAAPTGATDVYLTSSGVSSNAVALVVQ